MKNGMNCGHMQDKMCTCIANMNIANQLIHVSSNIRNVGWELDYETLDAPGGIPLCVVGICAKCGEQLCYGLSLGHETRGEKLIESVYTYLTLFHRIDGLQLTRERFDRDFLLLFHEQDRPAVRTWLDGRTS